MKRISILIFIILLSICNSFSQAVESLKVPAGGDFYKAFNEFCFRFGSYTDGEIYYKYDKSANAKFNYDILAGEMLFIGPTGDTLIVSNPKDLDYLKIDSIIFYYNNGYKELIVSYPEIKLAKQQTAEVEYVKLGSMGESNTSSAITNISSYRDQTSNYYNLVLNKDAYIRKKTSYFFIDKDNHFVKATKSNLLKIFSADSDRINAYLKQNDINFNKEKNLRKLLDYCNSPQ